MSVIRMETEAVNATAAQLRRGVAEMEAQVAGLQRARQTLAGAWEGGSAASEFLSDLAGLIRALEAACRQLEELERRLSYEMQEWLDADAVFGGAAAGAAKWGMGVGGGISAKPADPLVDLREQICGGRKDRSDCMKIWAHPPRNAEELAYQTMSLTKETPFVIMDLGNNEYLVLLRGTTDNLFGKDGWFSEGTDWDQNLPAFFGVPNLYQNAIVAALLNAVPAGATLHFSGHSQGGMVAQNLSVDPRLRGYTVKSVTMFGSPETILPGNKKTKYISYEASGDIVPHLDEIVDKIVDGPSYHPSKIDERHVIWDEFNAWNPDPNVSHGIYDDPGVLRDYTDMPFPTDGNWDMTYRSGRIEGVAGLVEPVTRSIKEIPEMVKSVLSPPPVF